MKSQSVVLLMTIYLVSVHGGVFEFSLANVDIFDKCSDDPDTLGMYEVFDLSQLTFIYSDGSVKVSGNVTCTWEGVLPTDRIEVRGNLYKFQRGAWQATLLSSSRYDYCSVFFDSTSIAYQVWTRYILEEDRKCFNNYGHVYHHRPFAVNTSMYFAGKMEGRHKIVARMVAYDKNNIRRQKSVCIELLGDYIKLK